MKLISMLVEPTLNLKVYIIDFSLTSVRISIINPHGKRIFYWTTDLSLTICFLLDNGHCTAYSSKESIIEIQYFWLHYSINSINIFDYTINHINYLWPADMLIKGISFKAHWTKERDGGILIVEHILPVNDPHTCDKIILI